MAKCAKCGRKLNNPISIARGLGSECAGYSSSAPRPQKNWKRKVINTSKIIHGESFRVGNKQNFIIVSPDNFEKMKNWLIKYNYILKDGDVSDKILDDIYNNPSQYFEEEDG